MRIISQKENKKRQLYLKLSYAAHYNSSSEKAAKKLEMTGEEFIEKCKEFNIKLPEDRLKKDSKNKEEQKITTDDSKRDNTDEWVNSLRSKAQSPDDS